MVSDGEASPAGEDAGSVQDACCGVAPRSPAGKGYGALTRWPTHQKGERLSKKGRLGFPRSPAASN